MRQDIWASGAVRKIADLKGKIVDGGLDGTPQNYLLKQAILKDGLKFSDMTYTDKFKTVPDQFAALRNKAVEVLNGAEPDLHADAGARVSRTSGSRSAT